MEELSEIRRRKLDQVWQFVNGRAEDGATIKEVAAALEKTPTYATDLLDQMVGFGWLRKEKQIIKSGNSERIGWRYFVTPAQQ
jgi:hypothetical protein